MPCIKLVVTTNCPYCKNPAIRFGKSTNRQRYRCKVCRRIFMDDYINKAYYRNVNKNIVDHLKEGCGIRSIARLLEIAPGTVLNRIKHIASNTKKPLISIGGTYELDELKTYIKNKNCDCWVIYALDKQSGQVVDMKVGKRIKTNLQFVANTLLLSNCKAIYTDRLNVYRYIIPLALHQTKRHGTNRIERKNLSLRTNLKRLNRKTICYSKSHQMLEACLRIYFWHREENSSQY